MTSSPTPHAADSTAVPGSGTSATGGLQHEAVAAYLRDAIESGELSPGDRLPSESELCRRFSTSRGPVRRAMATLRAEGLIASARGRRSVVLDTVPTQSFDDLVSFTQWCRGTGKTPGQHTLWMARRPSDPALAANLGITAGDPVVSLYRLRSMDDEPVMVERLNYPLEVGRHVLAFDPDSGSIYQHLTESGVDIDHAIRTIDAVGASAEDAELLDVVEGSPLLRVRRRAYDRDGVTLEDSDDRYLPGTVSFTLTSSRGTPAPVSMRSLD